MAPVPSLGVREALRSTLATRKSLLLFQGVFHVMYRQVGNAGRSALSGNMRSFVDTKTFDSIFAAYEVG